MSGRRAAIATNPVLVGAATVLVTLVAVFLAYNANDGLPFVPTYALRAEVPNAGGLIRGNEVRMGGARVGVVTGIDPQTMPDGRVIAVLDLKLERAVQGLPRDSALRIRPRSPLGLKYVELTVGRSRDTYPDGATMPLAAAAPKGVEIDDVFGMFDEATRAGSQGNLTEYGAAFAGRGEDLNTTFRELLPLVERLEPGARNLADPRTRFDRLFPAFEQTASELAPVAEQNARQFTGAERTFRALSGAREALKATISGGPEALDVATRELPAQGPFMRESAELFRRFRPGFASLAAAADDLGTAFRTGEPALRRAPGLNRRLEDTFAALERFAADVRVRPGLRRLARTVDVLQPTISFVTPAQTTCNYLALFFRNAGSALSESDVVGSFLRFGILALPQLPNSEAGPSSAPANGPPSLEPLTEDSFLHSNPYPNTAAPGQVRECEAGNERYRARRAVIGNQPGNQGTASERFAGRRR